MVLKAEEMRRRSSQVAHHCLQFTAWQEWSQHLPARRSPNEFPCVFDSVTGYVMNFVDKAFMKLTVRVVLAGNQSEVEIGSDEETLAGRSVDLVFGRDGIHNLSHR
jgi:hypothetical protein